MTDAFSHFTTGRFASHIGSDWPCNFEHQDCSLFESECLEHVSLRDIKSYTMIQARIDKYQWQWFIQTMLGWLMALLGLYGSATSCDQWRGSHLADSNFACLTCSLVLFWRSTFKFVNHEHSISSIISLSWHIMYEHCCLCPASLLASSYLRVNPLVDAMVEGWQLANACFFVRELNAGVLQNLQIWVERGGRW